MLLAPLTAVGHGDPPVAETIVDPEGSDPSSGPMTLTDLQDGVPCPRTDVTKARFTLTEDSQGEHHVETVLTFADLQDPCPTTGDDDPEYKLRGFYEPDLPDVSRVVIYLDLDDEMVPTGFNYEVEDEDGRPIASGAPCAPCAVDVDMVASTLRFDLPGPVEPPLRGVWVYTYHDTYHGAGSGVYAKETGDAIPNTLEEDATLFDGVS